jgi:hypothetical protein
MSRDTADQQQDREKRLLFELGLEHDCTPALKQGSGSKIKL